jgi:hypothetical protein
MMAEGLVSRLEEEEEEEEFITSGNWRGKHNSLGRSQKQVWAC